MNKKVYILVVIVIAFVLGYFTNKQIGTPLEQPVTTEKKAKYWVAPMDPNYRRDKPGKSPMGMDLVPVYEEDEEGADDNAVRISPSTEHNLGVKIATVSKTNLDRIIDTVGYITVDEKRIDHIHTYTSGWIRELAISSAGESVKNGDLLFKIYSPALVNAQEEYLLALGNRNNTLIKAAKSKLKSLGVADAQIAQLKQTRKVEQLVSIYSENDGIIADLKIREGVFVKPEQEIMAIENLDVIWILADVFERQSQWVQKGQPAIMTLPYIAHQSWSGSVDFVYPELDPITHTLKVRLKFANPGYQLKPNMYANVKISADTKTGVLAIPKSAVIYTEDSARVIVKADKGKYLARFIKPGIESGDLIEIKEGLSEGEKVVTSAQFLIDSEASVKASLNRLGHSHH